MPTLFIFFGFRFMFYSNEHEPMHIHVVKGKQNAKFLLFPVKLVENKGCNRRKSRKYSGTLE